MEGKRSVVITGASTGIGWGCSKYLLAKGFRVFGTVRRRQDSERLAAEFGESFVPLLADVTDEVAVRRAGAEVEARLGRETLAGLVNNAGIAVGGPLLHLTMAELRRQFEVNLIAPMLVTQVFAGMLGVDRTRTGPPGRVVQMSSVAGKMGLPFLGPYTASKHGLEGLSESLRRELMLYGIDVILIGPGAVVTPIWDKAEAEDFSRYRATDYGPLVEGFGEFFLKEGKKGLPVEDVARAVYAALTAKKPKLRYAVVPQRFKNWTLPRLLPGRLLDRLMGKRFGLVNPKA